MKLCMGCMKQMEDTAAVCPHCGFDEAAFRQESYFLTPGTVIGGRYIVGKVLIYGGNTVDYIGFDAQNNRRVIIKEYLPNEFSTRSEGEKEVTIYSGDAKDQFEQGLTNFLNEANRIQQLDHPEGIACVYDCVAENDTGYVISEYLEGQTLKEIMDAGKVFRVEEAKQLIETVLLGLSKVHPYDIIHCDISPETIMLTNSGEIKLLDFGATRYVTTANSKSLAIILKQGYAPEEQYRSRGQRGPWTDVYAVAAVMYRMITGVVPQESVERALEDDLKEPSKLGISIPENIENALMNALNVYQEDRTPSADIFYQELNSSNVARIKVKKKKNETARFPIWAKGLVASLFVVVAVGGVFLVRGITSDTRQETGESSKVIIDSQEGKSIDQTKQYNGFDTTYSVSAKESYSVDWQVEIEPEYTYNQDSQKNNEVFGNTSYDITDSVSRSIRNKTPVTDEESGLVVEVKDQSVTVTGKLVYPTYSSEKITYEEMAGMNVYALVMKLGWNWSDYEDKLEADEKTEGKSYYELSKIVTSRKEEIKAEEIKSKKSAKKQIAIKDIEKIVYYAREFYYWKSLPDFVGKDSEKVMCQTYKLGKNEKRETVRKTVIHTSLIAEDYYTFSKKYKHGYIVSQTVKEGETLDLHKDMGKLENGILLHTVKQVVDSSGTGSDIKNYFSGEKWKNATVKIEGEVAQPVTSVKVVDQKNKEVDCFRTQDSVTIIVTTQAQATPKPTQKPSAGQSSGNNSQKSSGSGSPKRNESHSSQTQKPKEREADGHGRK